MEKDKDKLPVLEAVDERFGDVLSASLREADDGTDQCPSPEDIAALVDGRITGQKKDEIMKHISGCDACCETFILAAELHKPAIAPRQTAKERRNIIFFRPLALAASILIVVISIYLFFKTDVPKTSRQLVEMDESTTSQDAEQPQPAVPKKIPPSPGKYSVAKAKKGAPASAGERRLEESTTKKADKKLGFYDRKDHLKIAEKKVKQKEEKKAGRIQTKKSLPEEEALELEETRGRAKRRGEAPRSLQKADKPVPPAPKKMKAAAQIMQKEQVEQIQEKGQITPGSLDAQTGIVGNEKLALLQKNRAWSQANLMNQQSQLSRTYTAKELHEMFRNTIDLSKQLRQEYIKLKKKAQKTGDFTEINAFRRGVAPLITIKTGTNVSNIYPNIGYFLSMSVPGSLEYQFFNLARSGWCEPKGGCYGMETGEEPDYRKKAIQTVGRDKDISEDQLMHWKELQPKLSGVFQEVAQYTIENIKQQQRIVPAER
ncbi:MAG: hypothetical protein PVH61_07985 [Candidatus Aminicenantes bacterium]|jgi:hypothetical protein